MFFFFKIIFSWHSYSNISFQRFQQGFLFCVINALINRGKSCRYFSYSPIYRLSPRKPNIPFNVLLKRKFPHVIFLDNSFPEKQKLNSLFDLSMPWCQWLIMLTKFHCNIEKKKTISSFLFFSLFLSTKFNRRSSFHSKCWRGIIHEDIRNQQYFGKAFDILKKNEF